MSLRKEKDLYPPIKKWLKTLLESNYPKKKIQTYDTSRIYLNKFIQDKNWISLCPQYAPYQIKIDILGVLFEKNNIKFVLVEVKNTRISLKDISQLIGYTRVVNPLHSIIISPYWISDPVKILFDTYKRNDILKFGNKSIKICKWDLNKKNVDYNFKYPSGSLL